jgi:hypothetical protein
MVNVADKIAPVFGSADEKTEKKSSPPEFTTAAVKHSEKAAPIYSEDDKI